MRARYPVVLALASAFVAACQGADDSVDVDVCAEPFHFALGDLEGHPDPLGVAPGEARAGRLTEGQLPPDPFGLSVVQPGDFVLANEHIALIVEDAGPSDLWDEWGGKPVGMGFVRGGAIVDAADFNEIIPTIGQYTLQTEHVSVVHDGSDGGPAVVRATGTLRTIASLGDLMTLVSYFSLPEFEGMRAALEYELWPGAEHVDVSYVVVNTEARDLPTQSLHAIIQDKRMPLFGPGAGFDLRFPNQVPFVAFVDQAATSYAWAVPEDAPGPELHYFLSQSGVSVFRFPEFWMPACRVHAQRIGRLHVGGPDLDGLLAAKARSEGTAQRVIRGTVTDPAGSPGGVSIHVTYEDGPEVRYLTRTVTASDGTYEVNVPADLAVSLLTWRRGDVPKGPIAATASDAVVDIALDPAGFIEVTVVDTEAQELPVRVQVIPAGSPAYVDPPPSSGELRIGGGRLHIEFPTDGKVRLRVPPGEHDVVVSRGYDYTMARNSVVVNAGETAQVPLALERVVSRPGYMCGDFHIHTFRSLDAGDPKDFKIRTALADGLEVPVLTDHRFVGDFEDTIQAMEGAGEAVAKWAYGVSAIEMTTFAWGHMGVFPLEPQPHMLNGGFIDWTGRNPPEVFDDARSRSSGFDGVDPAIIIMHGRLFGGLPMGEYFEAVGYNPATGRIARPELWDEKFRLVEVFNNTAFSQMLDTTGRPNRTLGDWFSFLNTFPERPYYAVGSSDSHEVLKRNAPVGYPRTCVNVGMNDPEALRAAEGGGLLRDVMYDTGDMTVNGGVFIVASARDGGVSMGDTATDADLDELVHVRVVAPCWVDVDRLEWWVNGQLDPESFIDLSDSNGVGCTEGDPVRWEGDVLVQLSGAVRDWVVFHASGDTPMDEVHPGRLPFGVTNPIFFTR
jgi:hypothetical protein